MKRSYACWGLRFSSELTLTEWAQFEVPHTAEAPDVAIYLRTATTPEEITGELEATGADEYAFIVPDVARYRVRHGREVVIVRAPSADESTVGIFVLGSVMGVLMYQRGLLGLHASVVRTAQGAVAFCGPTRAGKTTVAAWLCDRGFEFMSDDLCRVEVGRDGRALAYASTPRLKIRGDMLETLGYHPDLLTPDPRWAGRFHLGTTHADPLVVAPVCAIYLLAWGPTSITPRQGLNALRELVTSATYRPDLVVRMAQTSAHWQRCLELSSRVPLYTFARPMDVGQMTAAHEYLRGHIAERLRVMQDSCVAGG